MAKSTAYTPFGTVGDSNPALSINEFDRVKGSFLRSAYERKFAVRILWLSVRLSSLFL